MNTILAVTDWLIGRLLLKVVSIFYSACLRYLKARKKMETYAEGQLPVNKVNYQGAMIDLLSVDCQKTKISDLPRVLNSLLKQSVDNNYLSAHGNFNGYDKCLFRVNGTRFSTFFAFTDGERVLFHNRSESAPTNQAVKNDKYDMFGGQSFENSTITEKIGNSGGFLDVFPEKIDVIPGFSFEDTNELLWDSIFFPKTTVVMIGFLITLSSHDLNKAESINGKSKVEIYPITHTPNVAKMSSKANLAISYLIRRQQGLPI